ncbi:MAG: hypothetical protein ACFFDN_08200, partial [Candidatus Hodarchaeota archaeon]
MNIYNFDFDREIQKIFDFKFSKIRLVNWRKWLDISSKEEYESLALKLSGLSDIDNLFERLKTEITKTKQVKVNKESFLNSFDKSDFIFLCHTSGTSGSEVSDLKWIHMSDVFIQTVWAPGMQAIFEASGLNRKSSAVIFVPSRTFEDGLKINRKQKMISLYSSEFSQRLMLSLIKPHQYLIDQYKNSKNLFVLEKILEMEDISVVSAPASTILIWANIEKFSRGIKNFLAKNSESDKIKNSALFKKIKNQGLIATVKYIQNELSKKLSKCTLVFSISSLTEHEWYQIRNFMRWEKNKENFTNLYVASEIGPFAATIRKSTAIISPTDKMFIFPLNIPMIEIKGTRNLISHSDNKIGELLISRISENEALLNIKTGDIITIKQQVGLPQIGGDILRANFQLKKKLKISSELPIPKNYKILVGDYFDLEDIEIINPRRFSACLAQNCGFQRKSIMLFKSQINDQLWTMLIPIPSGNDCLDFKKFIQKLNLCPLSQNIRLAIEKNKLRLKFVENIPLESEEKRHELLDKVNKGLLPTGILKKWPIYVIVPE